MQPSLEFLFPSKVYIVQRVNTYMARVRPFVTTVWGPTTFADAFGDVASADSRNFQKTIITIVNRDATDELDFRVFRSNSTDTTEPVNTDENWVLDTSDTTVAVSTATDLEVNDSNWVRVQVKNTVGGSDAESAGIIKQTIQE